MTEGSHREEQLVGIGSLSSSSSGVIWDASDLRGSRQGWTSSGGGNELHGCRTSKEGGTVMDFALE
jgi:hypothetical protein